MDGAQHTSTSRKWYDKKKTKTITATSSNSNAVTTDISANNIDIKADTDVTIYGSELRAAPTGQINLTAGNGAYLYAVEDSKHSSYDVKKKSSWFGIRYNKDHTNDTRQEIEQLPATLIGESVYSASGGDTVLQGTVFKTSKTDTIKVGHGKYADAEAQLILAPITKTIIDTHTQERESTVWMKSVDKGSEVTTAEMPKFNQTPHITIPSDGSVVVFVPVSVQKNDKAKYNIQTSTEDLGKIALELAKQPGYEYLADLDKRNDINWQQIELIQKEWDYTQEGLTPGAAALIAIAITVAAGPAGSGLTASMVATNAAGIALQTQAVITLINNKGDIGKTLKDMASSDTVRNMAIAALTAGVSAKFNLAGSPDFSFSQNLANGIGRGVSNAAVDAAINGTSFEDALKTGLLNSLVDVLSAEAFAHGTKPIDSDAVGSFARNLAHKLAAGGVGCLAASAKSQDCDAGAIGAIVGEMVGDYLVDLGAEGALSDIEKANIMDAARLAAGSVALIVGVDVDIAANSAGIAVENNSLVVIPLVTLVAVIAGVVYSVTVPANKQDEVAQALYDLGNSTATSGKNAIATAQIMNLYMIGQIGSGINVLIQPMHEREPGSGVFITPQQEDTFGGVPGLEIQDFDSVLNNLGKPIDGNNGVTILINPQHTADGSDYVIYNKISGNAKNSKWVSPVQGVNGPGLRDHFRKYRDDFENINSVKQYDLSARLTIQNGKKFSYRDRKSNQTRVGYYDPDKQLFTATSESRKDIVILTHYPESISELKKLPGFTWRDK